MTEIERKALELVNETSGGKWTLTSLTHPYNRVVFTALCRAIEQHEAFRQEVSDAAEHLCRFYCVEIVKEQLERFIIAKPDPLEKLLQSIAITLDANDLREALDEAGLEIREKGK